MTERGEETRAPTGGPQGLLGLAAFQQSGTDSSDGIPKSRTIITFPLVRILLYADLLDNAMTSLPAFLVPDRWLSVDELAGYLGIKRDTVYKWITRRRMPAHKVGRLWKFKKEEIDLWVRSGAASDTDHDR